MSNFLTVFVKTIIHHIFYLCEPFVCLFITISLSIFIFNQFNHYILSILFWFISLSDWTWEYFFRFFISCFFSLSLRPYFYFRSDIKGLFSLSYLIDPSYLVILLHTISQFLLSWYSLSQPLFPTPYFANDSHRLLLPPKNKFDTVNAPP